MKNLILSFAMVTGFTIASTAQNVKSANQTKNVKNLSPTEKVDKQTDRAKKSLGLNDDQVISWKSALLNRNSLNQPLQEKLKGSTTPEERKVIHQQIKTNNDTFELSIFSVLTAEQKLKYDQLKKEKQHKK